MGRVALWLAQATTSSTPAPPEGGPRNAMQGGLLAGPNGPGGGQGGGRGDMMRNGAQRFVEHAHDHGDNHHWWMLAIVVVFALAIIGLAVWAIIAFSRAAKVRNDAVTTGSRPTAKEALDQRLAKGEIDPEDYEARKKLLDG